MPGLSAADVERVLRFVAVAEEVGGDQLFTPELLVELGKLIDADWVGYNELDRVRRRNLFYVCRPGEEEDVDDAADYWEIEHEHPICSRAPGRHGALKLSDFVTLRELRRSHVYAVWFRPFGVEREMTAAIPSPLWHTKTLLLDRGEARRDFSERDRLVLNLLRPHLARLSQAARVRRLLGAALAELDRADEHDSRGVVLLGVGGEVEFVSPPAQRMLRDFFPPAAGGGLPAALAEWLEAGAASPLVRNRSDRRLVIGRDNGSLVLEERQDEVALTARERDVLAWVARGKTNAEIAELLWLAPSTVRKHLENVYAKLGVSTRTAAVARFLGLVDAQAS